MKYYKLLHQLRVILKNFKLSLNDTSANVHYRHMFSYSNTTSYNISKVNNRRQRTGSCELCALGMGFGFWLKRFHARINIFLGSEVYFNSEKIDQQKIEKKKTNTSKTKQHEYRQAPVHVIYSVIIVFVPF